MTTPSRVIEAVNLTDRVAVATDNMVGRITDLFDRYGNDTEDAAEALSAVVSWPDGRWSSVDLSQFDFSTRNH